MPVHAEDHASFIQAFDVLKFGSRFYPEAGAVLVKAGVHDQSFDPKNNIDVATVRQRIRTLTDVEVGDLDVDSTTFGTDGSEDHYTSWLQDTGLTYIDRLVKKCGATSQVMQRTELTGAMKKGIELTDAEVLFLVSDVNNWKALTEAAQANGGAGDFSLVKTSRLFDQGEWSKLFQRALLGFDGLTVVKTKTTDHNRQAYHAVMITISKARGTSVKAVMSCHFQVAVALSWSPQAPGQLVAQCTWIYGSQSDFEQQMQLALKFLTGTTDLNTAASVSLHDALSCILDIWTLVYGETLIGKQAGRCVKDMILVWEQQDPQFAQWPVFYPGQTASMFSVIQHMVFPQLWRWSVKLWTHIYANGPAPGVLDSALSAQSLRTDELAADGYTVYRQFSTQIGATRKFTQTCLTCGKKGHTAEVCRSGDKGYGNKKRRRNGGKGNGGKGFQPPPWSPTSSPPPNGSWTPPQNSEWPPHQHLLGDGNTAGWQPHQHPNGRPNDKVCWSCNGVYPPVGHLSYECPALCPLPKSSKGGKGGKGKGGKGKGGKAGTGKFSYFAQPPPVIAPPPGNMAPVIDPSVLALTWPGSATTQ